MMVFERMLCMAASGSTTSMELNVDHGLHAKLTHGQKEVLKRIKGFRMEREQ